MIFDESDYYQRTFTKITCGAVTVEGVEFEECTFDACEFIETTMKSCRFIDCKFLGCNISALRLTGSRCVDVTFCDSKVIGIDWTQTSEMRDVSFSRSSISYSNFRHLTLVKQVFSDCEAKECDFTSANLSGAKLTGCDLERSVFHQANLTKADLSNAKNYAIDPRYTIVKHARFTLPEAVSLLHAFDITIT